MTNTAESSDTLTLLCRLGARMLLAAAVLLAAPAHAHRLGESYVFLDVSDEALRGRFEVTLEDLQKVIALDADGDGEVSKAEFQARAGEVKSYLGRRLRFHDGDRIHAIEPTTTSFRRIEIALYAMVEFEIPTVDAVPEAIDVEYNFLFDAVEPEHRGLLVIQNNTRTGTVDNYSEVSMIFGPGTERQRLGLTGTPWEQVFAAFVRHGVWHIWIGLDHILFIVSLLLPSVLVMQGSRWIPAESFRAALLFVVKVVTLFTVAHSITLSLAALDIIRLPSRLVEAAIAISITAAALNNLFGLFRGRIWMLVFGFGLFHGLGFANVLAPLGVEKGSLLTALVGFNVGVELGQLVIIGAVFPVLYAIRGWRSYQFQVVGVGSVALIVVSMAWFVERAFLL